MQGWAGVAGAAAVFYAAHKAADTFQSYRRQKHEERRMDAAEAILTLAFKLRRIISSIRSPMTGGGELYEADKVLAEADWYKTMNENEKRRAQVGQAALQRISKHQADWDRIFEIMPVARALFGQEAENQLQRIWRQITAVSVAAQMYRDDRGIDQEFSEKLRRDLWEIGGDFAARDEVGREATEAVNALENLLLPVIRADPGVAPRRR